MIDDVVGGEDGAVGEPGVTLRNPAPAVWVTVRLYATAVAPAGTTFAEVTAPSGSWPSATDTSTLVPLVIRVLAAHLLSNERTGSIAWKEPAVPTPDSFRHCPGVPVATQYHSVRDVSTATWPAAPARVGGGRC